MGTLTHSQKKINLFVRDLEFRESRNRAVKYFSSYSNSTNVSPRIKQNIRKNREKIRKQARESMLEEPQH